MRYCVGGRMKGRVGGCPWTLVMRTYIGTPKSTALGLTPLNLPQAEGYLEIARDQQATRHQGMDDGWHQLCYLNYVV